MIDQNKIKAAFGEDASLSFYQHSRQRYANQKLEGRSDELMIGVYHEEGGTSGEFSIECVNQHDNPLRLCMFDDSWKLFPYISELLDLLTRSEAIKMDDLVLKMIEIGIIDKSDRPL